MGPITIYGSGKQVRDILYATDLCEAFHAFYERGKPGIYNIGGESRNAISLVECVDLIADILGKRPDVRFGEGRHGDLRYFVCDADRARRGFGWEARTLPREGVGRLIEWVEEHRHFFA